MNQLYQDAMAGVRKNGHPSFFITFTCNPRWIEITENLLPGQRAEHRPDIVARVFWLKAKAMIKDLKKGCLGTYVGHVMTIEYQKRGLPHMHLLLTVSKKEFPYNTPEQMEQAICAELPDKSWDPTGKLTTLVTGLLIHGPCGDYHPKAPCMFQKSGEQAPGCQKRFPKVFVEETVIPEDKCSYPIYRRRDDGRTFNVKKPGCPGELIALDNRWVVPYNPYLLQKYEAHINVEGLTSIGAACKYIFKYAHKGTDRATVEVDDPRAKDEPHQHVAGRYITPTEAFWRMGEFDTHQCSPAVTRLSVHLEDQQCVYYPDDIDDEALLDKMVSSSSTIMEWFKFNSDPENRQWIGQKITYKGREYPHPYDFSNVLYSDFPERCTWEKKKWKRRKRLKEDIPVKHQKRPAVGRMYHATIGSGERYYLRTLLGLVPGAICYADLRTFEGVEYSTFRRACIARGLEENDAEWEMAFNESKVWQSSAGMRGTFIMGLSQQLIAEPMAIWTQFKADFADSALLRQLERQNINYPFDLENPVQDYALYLIALGLGSNGCDFSLKDCGLPEPHFDWGGVVKAPEEDYDPVAEAALANELIPTLNTDQRRCFKAIMGRMETHPQECHFYLQGPGGSGKTYLYKTICHYVRGQNKIVLCVASTGIAALLLPGGRTSHSQFKIPLDLTNDSTSGVKKQSKMATLLSRVSLIIWDEVPMQHKLCFETVHKLFCDIYNLPPNGAKTPLFAGVPAILGGDFAQILPVIPKGSRGDIVKASLRKSWIWDKLQKVHLRRNMRLRGQADEQWVNDTEDFKKWISRLPYDKALYGRISMPKYIRQAYDINSLIESIYPKAIMDTAPSKRVNTPFRGRAIITTKNAVAKEINEICMECFPGRVPFNLVAVDRQENAENDGTFAESLENLRAVDLAGIPPGVLNLKIGAPVMCLRNLAASEGLCNGTRMIVTDIKLHILEVMIVGTEFHGQRRHIPRIVFSSQEGELPYILRRKQFPLKPCFAMTINKSQGQTFEIVGGDFRQECFSHGQFYVSVTRTSSVKDFVVMMPGEEGEKKTSNVVWPEVLKGINRRQGDDREALFSDVNMDEIKTLAEREADEIIRIFEDVDMDSMD